MPRSRRPGMRSCWAPFRATGSSKRISLNERPVADLLVRGARLLTLAPFRTEQPRVGPAAGDGGAGEDGGLAARAGAIVATGRGDGWRQFDLTAGAVERQVGGRVVLPGFVDPHTHLCYAGERWDEFTTRQSGADYLAVLERGGGIHATVRATREASGETLLALTRARLARAVSLGTTTIEIKSGYGLDPEEELRQLRLIARIRTEAAVDVAVTYLALHAMPRGVERRDFLRSVETGVGTVAAEHLAEAVDGFIEKGVFEPDEARPVFKAAQAAGLAVTMHADQLHDVNAAAFAARLEARSADHLANVSADGMRVLERIGHAVAVLLPGSAFFVGYAPPDARQIGRA